MNFRKNVALIYHPMGNISGKMVYQAELSKFVKKNYRSSSFLTEVDPEKIQYLITGRFFYNGSYRDLEKKVIQAHLISSQALSLLMQNM